MHGKVESWAGWYGFIMLNRANDKELVEKKTAQALTRKYTEFYDAEILYKHRDVNVRSVVKAA